MGSFFYRSRLSLLMLGYARLMWLAALINRPFRQRLAEKDFSFLMRSQEDTVSRLFVCRDGRLRSSRKPGQAVFKLIWRDDQTGARVMTDMLRGKPRALYQAVVNGDLLLEGDARTISWYMGTTGRLEKVFRRSGKKKKVEKSE
ncbi:MAG: hypothetical protein ACLFS7_06795 [Desulfosudaceae bacterium]